MGTNRRALILLATVIAGTGCSSSRVPPATSPAYGTAAPAHEVAAAAPAPADPSGFVVLLSPSSPTRNGPISGSLRDSVTHAESRATAWRWYVNGDPVPVDAPVLPVKWFRRGDEIRAEAVAEKGGATVVSQRLRVMDAAPTVTAVAIDPMAPRRGDTLTATAAVSDPDDDPARVRYRWMVNGKLAQEGEGNSYSLAAAKRGDQICCEAVPDDGQRTGGWAASPIVEVVNSPPRILSMPPSGRAGVSFVYPLRVEDPDGDPLKIEIASGPAGMALNGETIRWAPDAETSGPQAVVIRVTDGAGGEARQEFTLTITK